MEPEGNPGFGWASEPLDFSRNGLVSYLRVSTARQGASGLGLEAQRKAVTDYLDGGRWELVAECVEVESGKRSDRPKLAEALRLCRIHNATLIIAKIDRLARNVAFISNLMESKVEFVAVDFPTANRLTVHILAAVAEHEAEMISQRIRDALAAAKARGKSLRVVKATRQVTMPPKHAAERSLKARRASAAARALDLKPIIEEIRAAKIVTCGGIARELSARGVPTARGGSNWSPMQASRLLALLD
jgi:DNA invertase Pin-like site-specific DNA recombinase